MRPLEVLLVTLVILSATSVLTGKASRRLLAWLAVLSLAALLAHSLVEGPHWQMIPAYLAVLLFPAALVFRRPVVNGIVATAMLLLVAGACAASAVGAGRRGD